MPNDDHKHNFDLGCFPKLCPDCNTLKWSCTDFYQTGNNKRCIPCQKEYSNKLRSENLKDPANREKYNECMRGRTAGMDKEQLLARQLKVYGITIDDYDRKLKEQDGKCAICKEAFFVDTQNGSRLHFDHNHNFDKRDPNGHRGLLCLNCNHLLGKAKDNIETLLSAISYLNKYGDSNS